MKEDELDERTREALRGYRVPPAPPLDAMLPDINGKEVCQRVRADNTLEDVRILCISGM